MFRRPLRLERPCCVWSYLSWALYAIWGGHSSLGSVCSAFVVERGSFVVGAFCVLWECRVRVVRLGKQKIAMILCVPL
jgi:hypothetical protein